MTDDERKIQELTKHFAGMAKVMSKSNKLLLENSKTSKMFKNIQKLSTKTMGDYQKSSHVDCSAQWYMNKF